VKAVQLEMGWLPTTPSTVTRSDLPVVPVNRPDAGESIGFPWAGVSTPWVGFDTKQPRYGLDLLKFLEPGRNPVVRTGLDTVSQGVFWPGWDIVAQNDYLDHPEWADLDKAIIDGLRYQLDCLRDSSFQDSLTTLLEHGRIYGPGIAELVWDPPTKKRPLTQLIKIITHYPYDWDFYVDGWSNLEAARHVPTGAVISGPDLPAKLLVWPWPNYRNRNWYGESDLLSIRYDIEALQRIEAAMIQGVRLLSIRPILHWYEGKNFDPAELSNVRRMLLGMDAGSVVSLPMKAMVSGEAETLAKGHEVKVLEDRASPEGLKQAQILRDMFAKRILNYLGIPDDIGMAGSQISVGSYAKAKSEMTLLNSRVVKAQHWLEENVNRTLIPIMCRWNWSLDADVAQGYRLPAFRFREIEEDALLTHGTMVLDAYREGLISKPTAQERLGFPVEEVEPVPMEADPLAMSGAVMI
jgi:hypothetical protein